MFGALFGLLVLAGCRLEVDVDAVIGPDGTGTVTVTATANAALVAQVDDLAASLEFGDAVAAGWTVDGPDATEDGGLVVVARRDVSGPQELANALGSIGPPLTEVAAGRSTDDDTGVTEHAATAVLRVPDGVGSWADADLVAAVGGLPWQQRLDAAPGTLDDELGFVVRLSLPGVIVETDGTERGDGVVEWVAPTDGSATTLRLTTEVRPDDAAGWARPVATIALVALLVWVVVAAAVLVLVIRARRRRARRRARRR